MRRTYTTVLRHKVRNIDLQTERQRDREREADGRTERLTSGPDGATVFFRTGDRRHPVRRTYG